MEQEVLLEMCFTLVRNLAEMFQFEVKHSPVLAFYKVKSDSVWCTQIRS